MSTTPARTSLFSLCVLLLLSLTAADSITAVTTDGTTTLCPTGELNISHLDSTTVCARSCVKPNSTQHFTQLILYGCYCQYYANETEAFLSTLANSWQLDSNNSNYDGFLSSYSNGNIRDISQFFYRGTGTYSVLFSNSMRTAAEGARRMRCEVEVNKRGNTTITTRDGVAGPMIVWGAAAAVLVLLLVMA